MNLKQLGFSFIAFVLFGCKSDEILQPSAAVVFTGSSTIYRWNTLEMDFPEYNVVNVGIGGTTMYFIDSKVDSIVHKYLPQKIFIYSGDNDIAQNVPTSEIIQSAESIVNKIFFKNDSVSVVFISVKPSPKRWYLHESFEDLNKQLRDYTSVNDQIFFMDVWALMLNEYGLPNSELFTSDSLHMNEKGYRLWALVAEGYME